MNYDNIPAVRRSDLWEIRKSPAHYLYKVTHQEEQTPALAFGSAAHKYILEPHDFWDEYALVPEVDRRTKDGKAVWNQYQKELDETGKSGLKIENYEVIQDMDRAIMANPTASALLKTGYHEVPIQWTDAETGELCKCRPDCLTTYQGDKYIVDYKTTVSCEDGAFERSCRAYGYKLQAAMYTEGVFNAELEAYKFAFVAQEKKPPYVVRVYFCDSGFVEEGMNQFRELINLYHKCKTAGEWPGYEDKEIYGDE